RTPALLLNARLTLGVQLIEAERRGRVGGRKHFHRNVDEADLEISLPGRSRRHGGSSSRETILQRGNLSKSAVRGMALDQGFVATAFVTLPHFDGDEHPDERLGLIAHI